MCGAAARTKLIQQLATLAESFPDYNIRNYVMRQAASFQKAPDTQDEEKLKALVGMWERQSLLYRNYKRSHMGIMDVKSAEAAAAGRAKSS